MPSRNPLEDMSTQKLMESIKSELHTMLLKPIVPTSEDVARQVNDSVASYLETSKEQGLVNSFKAQSQEVFYTWAKLYPSIWTRMKVRLFFLLGGKQAYHKQRWFHTILPFKIEYGSSTNSVLDHMPNFEDLNEEDYNYIADLVGVVEANRQNYWAKLSRPYKAVETNIQFMPVQPVNSIEINLVLSKEGVTFPDLLDK